MPIVLEPDVDRESLRESASGRHHEMAKNWRYFHSGQKILLRFCGVFH